MAKQTDLINGVKEICQDTTFTSTRILSYLNQGTRQIAGGMLLQYPDRTQVMSSPLPDLVTNSSLTTSTTLPYISMPTDFGRNLFFLVSSTSEIEIEVYDSYTELLRMYPELDDTNRVIAAVVRGSRLYYQGYPSTAETLIAYYNRNPYDMATLTGGSDLSFTATTNVIADAGNGLGVFDVGQTLDVTNTSNNNTNLTVTAVAASGATLTVSEDLTTEANTSGTIKSRPDGLPTALHEALLENYAAWKIMERKSGDDRAASIEEAKRYHGLFLGAMLNLEAQIESVPGKIQFVND